MSTPVNGVQKTVSANGECLRKYVSVLISVYRRCRMYDYESCSFLSELCEAGAAARSVVPGCWMYRASVDEACAGLRTQGEL